MKNPGPGWEHEELRSFVQRFYGLAGAQVQAAGPFLFVHLPEDVARVLAGPWAREETLCLSFPAEPPGAKEQAAPPDSFPPDEVAGAGAQEASGEPEPVTLGSQRLNQIVTYIRSRGRAFAGTLQLAGRQPAGPSWAYWACRRRWEPLLALQIRVHRPGTNLQDELFSWGVNLAQGTLYGPNLLPFAPGQSALLSWDELQEGRPPAGEECRRARLRTSDAAAAALLGCIAHVAREDASWALEAQQRLKAELEALERYYQHLSEEGQDEEQKYLRGRYLRTQEELDRWRPRIRLWPTSAAWLWTPVYISSFVPVLSGRQSHEIRHDPLEARQAERSHTTAR